MSGCNDAGSVAAASLQGEKTVALADEATTDSKELGQGLRGIVVMVCVRFGLWFA
jgi:hypothetical protein